MAAPTEKPTDSLQGGAAESPAEDPRAAAQGAETASILAASSVADPAAAALDGTSAAPTVVPTSKTTRKRIAVVALVVLALVLGGACIAKHYSSKAAEKGFSLVAPGTLTVAMSVGFPPFEQYDEAGNPTGYDVAVVQEAANRLGLECRIVDVPFGSIVNAVGKGEKYDVGVSAISINPDRSSIVDFSSPYYISDQAIVCKKGAFNKASELKKENVAAQMGSTGYDYATANINDHVLPCANPGACFAAMEQGSVSAVVVDAPAARYLIATRYSQYSVLETVATGEKYSFAVNKGNRALTEAINEALEEMTEDGTLESLQRQYGL